MDLVILSNDQAIFNASFPPATIVTVPGTISASNSADSNQMSVCVEGDEGSVVASGAAYTSGSFVTPGIGTLTIESLASDQVAKNAKCKEKGLILKGSQFQAKFEVISPAIDPSSGAPDPVASYSGTGYFSTSNTVLQAS
jgi:contractile injection system spike tip protein